MLLKKVLILALLLSAVTLSTQAATLPGPADQCRFVGIRDFTDFTREPSTNANEQILLSPVLKAPMAWNELIVSWNADTPNEAWLKVEVRGIYPDHQTAYYTMARWSRESLQFPRGTVRRQKDADGAVLDDTLALKQAGAGLQLRITLSGPGQASLPKLKFAGLSFLDNRVETALLPPNRAAWGKIIDTPELAQKSYPQEKGWCSPTSLTMVLTRWGDLLNRPELKSDVPVVASNVYDHVFHGTGNWPFNTAYAGSFPGLRAYVARFSDISELEDWVNAGIPVIISAPWHLLSPGRHNTGSGHVTVCIGFTDTGDVVINDPATNLQKGQKVRHIYKRENVIKAWKASHNTVYLIYPETAHSPADRFGHWDKP